MNVQDQTPQSGPATFDGGFGHQEGASERGASAVEYALLLGLVALGIFAAMMLLGVRVGDMYTSVATGF